jgi:cytochrome c oxidase assembly protein subunit 15
VTHQPAPAVPASSGEPTGWAHRWLPALSWASLAVNILIVVSGGVVRLTGSGLGCPTWPRCTDESFVPHGELGVHGVIEFGNRLVTFLIAAVAIATFVAAWQVGRRGVTRLALVLAIGVPAQAVLGGVTVLVDLNPWVVAGHLLLSMAMIGVAVALVLRVRQPDTPARRAVPDPVAWLVQLVFVVGWVVLYLGTVVTGSGPYAGDAAAPRNGLDPRAASQLHVDFVFLLVGLTVATVLVMRAVPAPGAARDAALVLLLVELAQGVVGFVQYFTGLPVLVVGFHLLGSALVAAAMTWLLLAVRTRDPAPGDSGEGNPPHVQATFPDQASPHPGPQARG